VTLTVICISTPVWSPDRWHNTEQIDCDCWNAIDCIDKMQFNTPPDIFVKLQELRHELHELTILITLVNVTGLSGIQCNAVTDKYAWAVADKIVIVIWMPRYPVWTHGKSSRQHRPPSPTEAATSTCFRLTTLALTPRVSTATMLMYSFVDFRLYTAFLD